MVTICRIEATGTSYSADFASHQLAYSASEGLSRRWSSQTNMRMRTSNFGLLNQILLHTGRREGLIAIFP